MMKLMHFIKQEDGATAIEYGLIASLVSVVIVAVLTGLGTSLQTTFTTIQNAL